MADATYDSNIYTPSGVSVTSTVTMDPVESTVTLNPTESTITVNPTETTITLNPTESTVHSDSVIELKPLESSVHLDMEPVVSDVCARLSFAPLPRTCIRQPYEHRIGFSLFGIELFAWRLEGESRTLVESPPERPRVVMGGAQQRSARSATRGLNIRVGRD